MAKNEVVDKTIKAVESKTQEKKLLAGTPYENEPTVPVFIPLEPGEKIGTTHPVVLNDSRLNVQKGKIVYVPKSFGEVILESIGATTVAEAEAASKANPEVSEI